MQSKKPIKVKEHRQIRSESSGLEVLKWLGFFVILAAGVYLNIHYGHVAWSIRASIGIVWAIVLFFAAVNTVKGRRAWDFMKSSRAELRKVKWPTRQETMQTTLIVIVVVIICALILWGLDSLFVWLIGWLVGQRG